MDYNADERVSPSQAVAAATAERHGIQTPANIAAILRFKKEIADREQHIPSSRSTSLDTYAASSINIHLRRACASRSPSPEMRTVPNFVFVRQSERLGSKAKATRRRQQDAMRIEFARLREGGAIGEPQRATGIPLHKTKNAESISSDYYNNPNYEENEPPSLCSMAHPIPDDFYPHNQRKAVRADNRKKRLAAQSSSAGTEPTQAQARPHSR